MGVILFILILGATESKSEACIDTGLSKFKAEKVFNQNCFEKSKIVLRKHKNIKLTAITIIRNLFYATAIEISFVNLSVTLFLLIQIQSFSGLTQAKYAAMKFNNAT